jgi:hypothetical protein
MSNNIDNQADNQAEPHPDNQAEPHPDNQAELHADSQADNQAEQHSDNHPDNQADSNIKNKKVELIGTLSVEVSIKYVNDIVDTILDVLDGRKLSPVSIIRVVANCMKVAAGMKVSNHNKKKIVLAGLEKFIKEKSGLSDVEIDVIMAVIDSVVNDAIDTIADISNGTLKLKKNLCFCC